jgi:hypothetical protein
MGTYDRRRMIEDVLLANNFIFTVKFHKSKYDNAKRDPVKEYIFNILQLTQI